MTHSAASFVANAWLCWILFNVVLLIAAPYLPARSGAFTNGLAVCIPDWVRAMLTDKEVAAVIAHERGHIACGHALQNLVRICLLVPRTQREAFRQELEADDYAAARGHGKALASALRKLSDENFDRFRANRLSTR